LAAVSNPLMSRGIILNNRAALLETRARFIEDVQVTVKPGVRHGAGHMSVAVQIP
jgi:hypothetical protein